MKIHYLKDPPLLTQIKRSFLQVWERVTKSSNIVRTELFEFESLDKSKVELKYIVNVCARVTVLATGQQFVVTQRITFGKSDWTLYTIEETDE